MVLEQHVVPCSVSKELVEYLAKESPEIFVKKGKVSVPAILFYLGFYIDQRNPSNSYSIHKDVLIRNPLRPYEVYKTDIYNGRSRNEVLCMVGDKILYKTDTPHFLHKFYLSTEVLTIGNIPKDLLQNVNNVGSITAYTDGFKGMDKRVDATKTSRNIVRP